jgi:hypothetical protein
VLLPADLPHPGPIVSHDTSSAADTASTCIIHVKPVTLYRTELRPGAPAVAVAAAAAPAGPPEEAVAASVTPLSADLANLNLQQQHVHHPARIAPAAEAAAAAAFPASSSTTSSSHGYASRVHPVSADDNVFSLPVPAGAGDAAPVPVAVLAGSAAAEPEPGHR